MKEKDIDILKKITKSSSEKISDSANFLSLFTEGYDKDPVCLIQLAIAIVSDKPLIFIAPHGTKIPENLKKMAKAIEYFDKDDDDSLQKAMERLEPILLGLANEK